MWKEFSHRILRVVADYVKRDLLDQIYTFAFFVHGSFARAARHVCTISVMFMTLIKMNMVQVLVLCNQNQSLVWCLLPVMRAWPSFVTRVAASSISTS